MSSVQRRKTQDARLKTQDARLTAEKYGLILLRELFLDNSNFPIYYAEKEKRLLAVFNQRLSSQGRLYYCQQTLGIDGHSISDGKSTYVRLVDISIFLEGSAWVLPKMSSRNINF